MLSSQRSVYVLLTLVCISISVLTPTHIGLMSTLVALFERMKILTNSKLTTQVISACVCSYVLLLSESVYVCAPPPVCVLLNYAHRA
jgi:hypothetical protein